MARNTHRPYVPIVVSLDGDGDHNCDGIADDVQIQAAIDEVEANGGGVVFIKAGTYDINAPLVISLAKGLTLIGEGWTTILKAKTNLNDNVIEFNPGASGVWARIADLKIDHNNTNQSTGVGHGIYAFGAIQCIFERIWFANPDENGLFLYQDGAAGTGHHNRIFNCLFDNGNNSNGDGRGLRIEASDENYVVGCDFESNGTAGAAEPNQIYDKSGLNSFIGNVFVGGKTGVKCEGHQSRIIGNMFDGINQDHAIRLNGNEHVVQGNTIIGIGTGSASQDYDGVWVDNVQDCNISNNVFKSDNTGTRNGINFANGATNCLALGNNFKSQGSGFSAEISEGTGNIIANNKNHTAPLDKKTLMLGIVESDTAVAVADGKVGIPIPVELNGYEVVDVFAHVHDKGVTGTTDVQLRRRRAGVDVDVLITKVTIGDEFYAADGAVKTDGSEDLQTGDTLYADVDTIHSGTAPNGLSVGVVIANP